MMRVAKWLMRVVMGLLLVLVVGGLALFLAMRASLPDNDAEFDVAGLPAAATILRDEHGVPHIDTTGDDEAAVFFALGFAHAQDRLWQMELSRRASQGRLSELFGSVALDADIFFRAVDFAGLANSAFAAMSPRTKRVLSAYAEGVNAFMDRPTGLFEQRFPPEFLLLWHRPEPWQPADSVAILKQMSLLLSMNLGREILRYRLADDFRPAEIRDLLPPTDSSEPALPDLRSILPIDQAALSRLPDLPGTRLSQWASNNWVLAGTRTESGKPILANDPHLGLQAPSLWYLVHLALPAGGDDRTNIVGASLPGTPLVAVGRNDRIAWGLTNTGADVQDIYLERLVDGDPTRYLTPDGPVAFETDTVDIEVRFDDPFRLTRRWSRRGPVTPDLPRFNGVVPAGYAPALAWTSLAPEDSTMEGALEVMTARSWDDFLAATRKIKAPMQSAVYADTDGNIGLIAPADVPVRRSANLVHGRAPVPGWDATYAWVDRLPFDALPRQYNPRSGMIATANARIVPTDYPHHLTWDWERPYRIERIEGVLAAREKHTVGSVRALMMDDYSRAAAEIVPLMLDAVGTVQAAAAGGREATALDLLRQWDFRMAGDAAAPLIYITWLIAAERAVFGDDLGGDFTRYRNHRVAALAGVLRGAATARDWCDDQRTSDKESCGETLRTALTRALDSTAEDHGGDVSAWRWAEAHVALSAHQPLGKLPLLGGLFNVEVPSPGGPYTVNRGAIRIGSAAPLANQHASSYRGIYDFADLEASLYMHTTGQSGHPLSPLYRNLAKPWARGEFITIPTQLDQVRGRALGTVALRPAKR